MSSKHLWVLLLLLSLLSLSTFDGKAQNPDSLLKVLDTYKKTGKATKAEIGGCMNSIARAYLLLADFPVALDYYQQALGIYREANDEKGIAATLSNIGTYYMNFPYYTHENYLSSTRNAAAYFERSLAIYERLGDQKPVIEALGNLGHIYLLIEDNPKALSYINKALGLNELSGNQRGVAENLWILGDYYFRTFDYSKALVSFRKSLLIYKQLKDNYGVAEVLLNSAAVYRKAPDTILQRAGIEPSERYSRAIENQKQSLQILDSMVFLSRTVNVLLEISKTYEQARSLDSAFVYYKKFILIRDNILNVEKEKEINQMEVKYAFERKEDSIKLQEELRDEKFKQQQDQLELQLTLSNKEKDLQKINYLKTQADLQNEQLEKKGKEKQLTISEKEKQLQLAKVKTLITEKSLNALKQQQQWVYIISGLVLLGSIAFYSFYRVRLQQIHLKAEITSAKLEKQQKEAEFQRQLGDISLSALRSQMNPHFIFNCLNSIKLYTTQNDTEAASEYLTKFSRLIRRVLENSRNDRITLASELDALQLYIEMEVMRFKEKLKYNICIGKEVDTEFIEIPPLLLQPYVENAIWHGLMQKEEGGRIDINVGISDDEPMLVINVKDNGIGRAKSAVLMSKSATKHKSYGMKVTSERLVLINRVYKTGANVTIHDLADENDIACGTEVTIKIPIQ